MAEPRPRPAAAHGLSRPMTTRHQQAPPLPRVQLSTLREYQRLESRTWRALSKAYQKLIQSVSLDESMAPGVSHLLNRLLALMEKPSLEPVYVGVLGSAGAGKSSLINALLQQEKLLPVSGRGTGASCTVQASFHHGQSYKASVHFLSSQEWRQELRHLSKVLQGPGRMPLDGEDGDEEAEARRRLRLVYGPGAEQRSLEELLRAKPQNMPATRTITLTADEASELSLKLEAYVQTRGGDGQTDEAETGIWPLVKHVEVALPRSDLLPAGVVLVDIPSSGSLSANWDETWKKTLDKCSAIWVLSDVESVLGGHIPTALLDECVRACQRGLCRHLALVVTKTDKLHLAETLRETEAGNGQAQSQQEAVLERKEMVHSQSRGALRERLQRRLPAHSQILEASDLVYTVSAQHHWQQAPLDKAESGVPSLREHIWTIVLDRTRGRVARLVADALGLLQLLDAFRDAEMLPEPWPLSELQSCVEEEVRQLDVALGRDLALLEQRLTSGVQAAQAFCQRILGACLARSGGNRGLYQSLRAACLQGGVYTSRHLPRMDLNQALAQPMYDQVDAVFGGLFGTGRAAGELVLKLEAFWCSLQERTRDVVARRGGRGSRRHALLAQEVSAELGALEGLVLRRKRRVYESLCASVQRDLQPCYEEAAQVTGQGACVRLKDAIRRGVAQQAAGGMFERARDKMLLHCLQLQKEITEAVRNSVGAMLTLAAARGGRPCTELPDVRSECRELEKLRRGLREAAEDVRLRRGLRAFLLRGTPAKPGPPGPPSRG